MVDKPRIRLGSSCLSEPEAAIDELVKQLDQENIGLVVVFVSSAFDLQRLGSALTGRFGSATIIGCTSAGVIGTAGYMEKSISGVSIHRDDLVYEVAVLENLADVDFNTAELLARNLKNALRQRSPCQGSDDNAFAFMLIDGLSVREEIVTRAFYDGLGGIALVGGSASDDLILKSTMVLSNGRFISNAALLLVATTPFPFEVFKIQHFVGGDERLVVTGAIPNKRIVTEINGCPAAEEYARAIGINPNQLDPMTFSAHPVVVRVGNVDFVRSIQKMNTDGSLTFYCAIDEGIVFKLAKGLDMIDNLGNSIDAIVRRIGKPSLILGFDCILRSIEAKRSGIDKQIGTMLAAFNVVGFSTFGEQYRGLHVNQTFTGLAIGSREHS